MALHENLLVLAGIALAVALLRAMRRQGGQRGYALVLALELALALAAMLRGDRYLGTVAIFLCALTVVLPALLERAARQMFALGRPRLAVRLTGLRALLMPGAGLGRQQQILDGFALLDRSGVDAALAHFRGLVARAEEPAELAVIHEQIVAMLLYDQRWGEALAHYESQFHPGFAAVRPALALGVLRAYGEVHRLPAAAALLRAIEDGPIGAEPGAAELLAQARLTFLAYAGAAGAVDDALAADRGRRVGMSPASATLLQGLARARGGQPEQARALLQQAAALAKPNEQRLVGAAGRAAERADEAQPPLEGELQAFVQAVAERLRAGLREGRGPRRLQPLLMTSALIAAMAAVYTATLLLGRAGVGLLEVGALTPELYRAGSWGRVLTASLVHGDLVALLLNSYSIWLAGHVLERIQGWARTGLVALWGAAAGLWATAAANPDPAQLLGGGNAIAVAMLVATLWTLTPARTPGLQPAVRRSLAVTLLILLGAHLFACLPSDYGLRPSPLALGTSAFVASLLALALPPALPRLARRGLALLCLASVAAFAVAGVRVAREDPVGFAAAHRDRRPLERGVRLSLPASFEPVRAVGERRHPAMPVFPGWIDTQALRGGHLVELVVVEAAAPPEGSALFVLDPALAHELVVRHDGAAPPGFGETLEGSLTSYTLQRNGEAAARVVERRLGEAGPTLVLLAAPPAALEQAPGLYARIVADAAREPEAP